MTKLSPQKEYLLSFLRKGTWVCASKWADRVKDDRIRFVELNRDYMPQKGYKIESEPCRGKACGRTKCPLNMRKAVRITEKTEHESNLAHSVQLCREFDKIPA